MSGYKYEVEKQEVVGDVSVTCKLKTNSQLFARELLGLPLPSSQEVQEMFSKGYDVDSLTYLATEDECQK